MTNPFIGTSGPRDARIAIVGESYGADEAFSNKPFIGMSGKDLTALLTETGISRNEVFLTNVVNEKPLNNDMWNFFYPTEEAKLLKIESTRGLYPKPNVEEGIENLRQQLAIVKPDLVIGFGNYALWALTDDCFDLGYSHKRRTPKGIGKWRGSQLHCSDYMGGFNLLPTYHPAAALKNRPWRYLIRHDLGTRVKKALANDWEEPKYDFIIRPTISQAVAWLNSTLLRLDLKVPLEMAVDLETRGGQIACIGLSTYRLAAICIPFMCIEDQEGYWSREEELIIVDLLRKVLLHPNLRIIGQNFLYDAQYTSLQWQIIPEVYGDTMILHHLCWPGTPKGLSYLSSLYCLYHRYWKDEGKEWTSKMPEEQLWIYNCKDAVTTFEIHAEERKLIKLLNLEEQADCQMQQFPMLLEMMLRGTRIDLKARATLAKELKETSEAYAEYFNEHIPEKTLPRKPKASPWWTSPKQQMELFYDILGLTPIKSRKTKQPTVDDEALEMIGNRKPVLRQLTRSLQEYRSIKIFKKNFVDAEIEPNGRMKCFFDPTGTKTFRLSSSKNAFDRGANLQTIPKGTEDE